VPAASSALSAAPGTSMMARATEHSTRVVRTNSRRDAMHARDAPRCAATARDVFFQASIAMRRWRHVLDDGSIDLRPEDAESSDSVVYVGVR